MKPPRLEIFASSVSRMNSLSKKNIKIRHTMPLTKVQLVRSRNLTKGGENPFSYRRKMKGGGNPVFDKRKMLILFTPVIFYTHLLYHLLLFFGIHFSLAYTFLFFAHAFTYNCFIICCFIEKRHVLFLEGK